MATTLTDNAVYGIPYPITVSFTDSLGTPFIPDTLTWTLTDSHGTIINLREDVVIITPAASVTITLGNDDILYSEGPSRVLTISGTYSGDDLSDVVYFSIEPESLLINNADYNRIMTIVGYPTISATDLELTDDQIKALYILPVLKDMYFVQFPLLEYYQASVTSNFSIAFPDSYTYGVLDTRINTRPFDGSARTANPILNDLIITEGGRSQRMWGTPYDYGYSQVKIMERIERDATIQSEKATKIRVNHDTRVVEGYTNTYGALSITWAKYSRNFNDVKFNLKNDVIKLAQAQILEYLGMLRNQATNDLPTELDGSEFLQKAETYRDEVMEKWRNHTKVIILR